MNPVFLLMLLSIVDLKAKTLSPTDIARLSIDRDTGKSSYGETVLISCSFKLKNGKRKCIADKRKKMFFSIFQKNYKKGVDRNLSIITYPSSEKNVGFLQDDIDGDSEQWLYLPKLKKTTRLVSNKKGVKTGSYFGSVISYEDLEKRKLEEYDYKLHGEESIDQKKCWILSMHPKKNTLSSYGKVKAWIDQESYITVKGEAYDKSDKLLKTFLSKKIKMIKGVWLSEQQVIFNHQELRMSMLKNSKTRVNLEIKSDLLSIRALEDSVFRQPLMKKLQQ